MIRFVDGTIPILAEGQYIELPFSSRAFDGSQPTEEFEQWMRKHAGQRAKTLAAYTQYNMGWLLLYNTLKRKHIGLVIRHPDIASLTKLTWA